MPGPPLDGAAARAYPDFRDGTEACTDLALANLFYPGPGQLSEPAKAMCRRCPKSAQCLEFALTTRQRHGVWGGTTPTERTFLINRLKRGNT